MIDDRTWSRAEPQVHCRPRAHRLHAVQHRAAQRRPRQPAVAADGHRQGLVIIVVIVTLLRDNGVFVCEFVCFNGFSSLTDKGRLH